MPVKLGLLLGNVKAKALTGPLGVGHCSQRGV